MKLCNRWNSFTCGCVSQKMETSQATTPWKMEQKEQSSHWFRVHLLKYTPIGAAQLSGSPGSVGDHASAVSRTSHTPAGREQNA